MIARRDQAPVVEEFFQLFKTPWEFYEQGRLYDVVVASDDAAPLPSPKLLICYSAAPKRHEPSGVFAGERRARGTLFTNANEAVPIHSGLLTFAHGAPDRVCLRSEGGAAGIRSATGHGQVLRVGYDLFDEIAWLLSRGQPVESAHIPSLELHIAVLRDWIVEAGLPLVEIPPAPAGYPFAVCLTHDIDFVGIRRHKFDHTMWGFLYRSTVGGLINAIRGRVPLQRLAQMWRAAWSLPFVYLGWIADFWEPFAWYVDAEKGLPATYYLIPFKRRPGDQMSAPGASRRATAYDVEDVREWAAHLQAEGCEVGVHGIDAWHSVDKGRAELERVSETTGADPDRMGIRMHWLLRQPDTASTLAEAGYLYDSTVGYNETVGYHAGSTQVFQPPGARTLLELPMHIQDGALFYPQRLGLSDQQAAERCAVLIRNAARLGGVLTVLWHDRSHGPERFWGEFYLRLLSSLKSTGAWFGTGRQVVRWFGSRRAVRFEQRPLPEGAATSLRYDGEPIEPPLRIRFYNVPSASGTSFTEYHWDGRKDVELKTSFPDLAAISAL